jgi:hypothetical protein
MTNNINRKYALFFMSIQNLRKVGRLYGLIPGIHHPDYQYVDEFFSHRIEYSHNSKHGKPDGVVDQSHGD